MKQNRCIVGATRVCLAAARCAISCLRKLSNSGPAVAQSSHRPSGDTLPTVRLPQSMLVGNNFQDFLPTITGILVDTGTQNVSVPASGT